MRLARVVLLTFAFAASTQAGLVAHWSMEEGSGTATLDEIRAVSDGFVNTPTWITTGMAYVPGGTTAAINFDAVDKDHVLTSAFTGVLGTNARSTAAWIRTSGPADQDILSWGQDNSTRKWVFRLQGSNGPIDGNLRVEVNGGYQVGTTDLRDGRWHHVAATWENDGTPNVQDVKFYVDGSLEAISASLSRAVNTTAGQNVRIGSENWNQNRPFNGGMDDVRIYDHALTPGEIRILATGYDTVLPDMRHDANRTSDPNTWFDVVGVNQTSAGSLDLDLSGVAYDASPGSAFTGIQGAYVFDGSASGVFGTPNFESGFQGNPTNDSVTLEVLFRPDDLTGQEVVWEFGGATDGSSLTLNGDILQFIAKDSGQNASASLDLDVDGDGIIDYGDFLHIVAAVDLAANSVYLYLNGASPTPGGIAATGNINDWAGADGSGFGSRAGNETGGSGGAFGGLNGYAGFQGDIARFGLYQRVLSPLDVNELYINSVLIPEPTTLALVGLGIGLLRRRRRR
ncbi:LamG domain-containing protein [bacterium]|nr:LamG domain-containing protein [bacterium]